MATVLSQSIDETFSDLIGDRAKEALFSYLEGQGFNRREIADDLPRFGAFLEKNFGRAGGVMERQIAKRLYSELGLDLVEVPSLTLSDYVDIAFRRLTRGGATHLVLG